MVIRPKLITGFTVTSFLSLGVPGGNPSLGAEGGHVGSCGGAGVRGIFLTGVATREPRLPSFSLDVRLRFAESPGSVGNKASNILSIYLTYISLSLYINQMLSHYYVLTNHAKSKNLRQKYSILFLSIQSHYKS